MKTLAITNQKGGVGKTTLVVNLAQFATEIHNKKVAVIDLDTQGNASWTLARDVIGSTGDLFFNPEIPVIHADRKLNVIASDYRLSNIETVDVNLLTSRLNALKQQLEAQGTDFFVIDTPPSMGKALVCALLVTDCVLCPIELEAFSLQGVKKMRTVIGNVKTSNTALKEIGLLPSRVDNRNPTHRRQLAEIRQAFPELICPYSVSLRGSIAESVATRTWIGFNKKTSARKAIKELADITSWILNKTQVTA